MTYNPPHAFPPELAVKYGVDEALMIVHFQFWINFNKANGNNYRENRTWSYQTREAIADHFPYWTPRQVRRITDSLVKKNVLIKGNFNKLAIDKTTWFAFKDEEMFTMAQTVHRAAQTGQAIPESKPESKPSLREVNDYKQTKPSKPTPKKDPEKSMPFAQAKRDVEKPPSSRYPLKASQKPILDLLKVLDLGCDDEMLFILIRSHSERDLIEAIAELRDNQDRGVQIKKTPLVYLRYLLKELKNPETLQIWRNRRFAQDFADSNCWYSLVVSNKCSACSQTGDEIPHTCSHETFKEILFRSYEKYKRGR